MQRDMETLFEGLREAVTLLATLDAEVRNITALTLYVSGIATMLSVFIGVPAALVLALARFPGRTAIVSIVNVGMGLPPVIVGLFVALMLWRSGPLGAMRLIYTPAAMMIAQALIATPIVTGVSLASLQQLDPRLRLQLLGLGASWWQIVLALLWETRLPLLAAVMAGFGGVISEVGASMMVGGNVAGHTRVLTTAIVLETSRGQFALAMALGLILLLLAYIVTLALTSLQQRARRLK